MAALAELGIIVVIDEMPNELPDPVRFSEDSAHASYDPDAVGSFLQILVNCDRVFKQFRTGFLGKASPVHFFWGSFDLAVTRFSGRRAPRHPGGVPHLPDAVAHGGAGPGRLPQPGQGRQQSGNGAGGGWQCRQAAGLAGERLATISAAARFISSIQSRKMKHG